MGRVRHRYTYVDGVRLHWGEIDEASAAPPVVLLHGLNDCYLTWKRVAPRLARDRRVLMPDLPGHGLSARPDASYRLDWYAHVMALWLEAVGVEQVDILGHSFGGGVAQMLLLERARIRRLVLFSSGGLGREIAAVLRLAAIPLVVESWGQPFMGPGTRLALKGAGPKIPPTHIAALSAINAQSGSARAFARTVRDIIDWRGQRRGFMQRAHEIAELPAIAVFWGDRDTIIPVAHAKSLADSVEGIQFRLFEGCGHYLHHEQSESFADALREFLDAPSVPVARLRATSPT